MRCREETGGSNLEEDADELRAPEAGSFEEALVDVVGAAFHQQAKQALDSGGGDARGPAGVEGAREESEGEAGGVEGLCEVLPGELVAGEVQEPLKGRQLELELRGAAPPDLVPAAFLAPRVEADALERPLCEFLHLGARLRLQDLVAVAFLEAFVQPVAGDYSFREISDCQYFKSKSVDRVQSSTKKIQEIYFRIGFHFLDKKSDRKR